MTCPCRIGLQYPNIRMGPCYIVLDTDEQRYYLMDTCGADLTSPAGSNIDELLDYVWEHWIKPLA
jgi:hypothetical protein